VLTAVVAFVGAWMIVVLLRASRRAETGTQLRRLRRPSRWQVPSRVRPLLERALEDAALQVEPEGACELWLGAVLGTTTFAFALAPGAAPIVALLGLAAGPCWLRLARGRAQRRFVVALPAALEHVAAALRGGTSVPEAVGAIADGGGPLAGDFERLRTRATLGGSVGDALAAWSDDRDLGSVRATAGALAIAATVGGPAAGAIDGLAASLRERLGAIAEARSLSAQARLSAIVVGFAPAGYFAFSALVDPSSVGALFATAAGRVCFGLGLVLEALAVVWMRRIVRTEEFS
jgi:tight adherence protein B